ncbi:MAG TPA: chemotaxis protein CheW [Clostridiaceae bacterium]|jgi:purine-binding chemotaxis protein CheW|nr:chemotaxis protein CheW [Clostridiaceae bacterium]
MQIIIFQLGSEQYGIETSKVQSIDKIKDITKVPCAPDYIKGLINLRGSIVTVYDPYVLLGIENKDRNIENILIIEVNDEQIGMLVDKVIEVVEIDNAMVKDVSASKGDAKSYIKGTIKMEDFLVTLIDINELLNAE